MSRRRRTHSTLSPVRGKLQPLLPEALLHGPHRVSSTCPLIGPSLQSEDLSANQFLSG